MNRKTKLSINRKKTIHKIYNLFPNSTKNRIQNSKQDSPYHPTHKRIQNILYIPSPKNIPSLTRPTLQISRAKTCKRTISQHPPILQNSFRYRSTSNTKKKNNSLDRIQTNFLLTKNQPISQPQSLWNTLSFPISASKTLQLFINSMSNYQKGQILMYKQIYFLGLGCQKHLNTKPLLNYGFDNERGDYKYIVGDHIAYRYEVLASLGSGTFGQVLKVYDHKDQALFALKIIRNKKRYHRQAKIECQILDYLKINDPNQKQCIMHCVDHFLFRNHPCLVFKLMALNLYEYLYYKDFKGLSAQMIRKFAYQILLALKFQEQHKIIHCDLKPENIMLESSQASNIKIIDYGSACFQSKKLFSYIQSRYYRAPQIILGVPYSTSVDI